MKRRSTFFRNIPVKVPFNITFGYVTRLKESAEGFQDNGGTGSVIICTRGLEGPPDGTDRVQVGAQDNPFRVRFSFGTHDPHNDGHLRPVIVREFLELDLDVRVRGACNLFNLRVQPFRRFNARRRFEVPRLVCIRKVILQQHVAHV